MFIKWAVKMVGSFAIGFIVGNACKAMGAPSMAASLIASAVFVVVLFYVSVV